MRPILEFWNFFFVSEKKKCFFLLSFHPYRYGNYWTIILFFFFFCSGGDDGKTKIWNTNTGFCFVTFAEHSGPITDVVFSLTGTVVVSSSLDGTVRAFDLVRYRNFRTFTAPVQCQVAFLICFLF